MVLPFSAICSTYKSAHFPGECILSIAKSCHSPRAPQMSPTFHAWTQWESLIIKLALATLLIFIIPTGIVKHYWKLDSDKALDMTGNLSQTYQNEVDNDVNVGWHLLKTYILIADQSCIPTKRVYPFRSTPIEGINLALLVLFSHQNYAGLDVFHHQLLKMLAQYFARPLNSTFNTTLVTMFRPSD